MPDKINLDALIPREDLAIEEEERRSTGKDSVSEVDLRDGELFLLNIFKPDFQRETTEWDYTKIAQFVSSFLKNELIPAVILWQSSGGRIFVIDGAHRLSSLIAWINDDYGDGKISRKMYGGNIPDEQAALANKARKYIEKNVGAYTKYKKALIDPDLYDKELVNTARSLSNAVIKLQWVNGDVASAERSFFNINQKAAPINSTEKQLIRSRHNPNCIAARAIMRSGMGHKYWMKFEDDKQSEIEELASEIYSIMFTPKLSTPIKTADVPMCGKHSNNSLQIIYELVNICIPDYAEPSIIDEDGELTIKSLKITRKIVRMMNSKHESSLGLHPLIYFYVRFMKAAKESAKRMLHESN